MSGSKELDGILSQPCADGDPARPDGEAVPSAAELIACLLGEAKLHADRAAEMWTAYHSTRGRRRPLPWMCRQEEGRAKLLTSAADFIAKTFVSENDARLIAAAPDLLEALKLADAALAGANMNMQVVERKVRAAIAKAQGQ